MAVASLPPQDVHSTLRSAIGKVAIRLAQDVRALSPPSLRAPDARISQKGDQSRILDVFTGCRVPDSLQRRSFTEASEAIRSRGGLKLQELHMVRKKPTVEAERL